MDSTTLKIESDISTSMQKMHCSEITSENQKLLSIEVNNEPEVEEVIVSNISFKLNFTSNKYNKF